MSLIEPEISATALFTRMRLPAKLDTIGRGDNTLSRVLKDRLAGTGQRQHHGVAVGRGRTVGWLLVVACLIAASAAGPTQQVLGFFGATTIVNDARWFFLLLAGAMAIGQWEWAYRRADRRSRLTQMIAVTAVTLLLLAAAQAGLFALWTDLI